MPLFAPLNPPITSFEGRRIWLVGASTGIGAALAGKLIALGAKVAVSARSAESLQTQFGERALVLPLDMTDSASLEAAVARIQSEWGGFDLVLAIAGTYAEMQAQKIDLPAVERIVELNLTGVFRLFAAVKDTLITQRSGGFGIVSSVAGYGGLPNSLAYGATKAACNNLAQSLWLDLKRHKVAVYLITPGFVETPLTAKNRFPMPFIITAQRAADEILAGLVRGDFEIHFPKRFSRMLKVLNMLPHRLYFWLVRKGTGA